jgi:CheY-like chemotaxis protein
LSTSRATILIVEDNALNLELATDLLAAAGYTIRQARTGEEGLHLASAEAPDLILLDLRLPGLDGYATLRALKADRRTAVIPTVALTAQAMTGDKEAALAAGFHDYISKPIDTRTFSQIVARVLGSAA